MRPDPYKQRASRLHQLRNRPASSVSAQGAASTTSKLPSNDWRFNSGDQSSPDLEKDEQVRRDTASVTKSISELQLEQHSRHGFYSATSTSSSRGDSVLYFQLLEAGLKDIPLAKRIGIAKQEDFDVLVELLGCTKGEWKPEAPSFFYQKLPDLAAREPHIDKQSISTASIANDDHTDLKETIMPKPSTIETDVDVETEKVEQLEAWLDDLLE